MKKIYHFIKACIRLWKYGISETPNGKVIVGVFLIEELEKCGLYTKYDKVIKLGEHSEMWIKIGERKEWITKGTSM